MIAMATAEPRLCDALQMLENFNLELLRRYMQLKPDFIGLPEDLAMQDRQMISPTHYRKYIKLISYLKFYSTSVYNTHM